MGERFTARRAVGVVWVWCSYRDQRVDRALLRGKVKRTPRERERRGPYRIHQLQHKNNVKTVQNSIKQYKTV